MECPKLLWQVKIETALADGHYQRQVVLCDGWDEVVECITVGWRPYRRFEVIPHLELPINVRPLCLGKDTAAWYEAQGVTPTPEALAAYGLEVLEATLELPAVFR